jgi:radical SAM protein with 4Fe4S-binding SPASM domain
MSSYARSVKRLPERLAPRLGNLDIELTERCNNDCIHCCINLPAGDESARTRETTAEQIKGILTEAASLGCLRVRFTGGEPLLRHDFEELYLFARRLGMKVLLFTNATLITPELADLFARIPPLARIESTAYGMSAESYEAVTRRPGSFSLFRRGVDLLLERNVPFILKSALLPPNRHEMEAFEAWCATIPWMDKPPSYSLFFDLRNRRDDGAKNEQIAAMRLSPVEGLAVLARDEGRYRKTMQQFAQKFMAPPGDRLLRCGAGRGLCIDAYGRVQPCMGVRAPELTVDAAECTSSSPLADALKRFASLGELRATNPAYLERCANCFLKGLCEQCPAKSWSEHGALDTPVEYLCEVAHAQAHFLGWLKEGEKAWTVKQWRKRIAGNGRIQFAKEHEALSEVAGR